MIQFFRHNLVKRIFYNLQFLPHDSINRALLEIFQFQKEKNLFTTFFAFNKYFVQYWMAKVQAKNFSMYRIEHRTDNINETFHSRMSRCLSRHPNIYNLLKIMRTLIKHENHKDHKKYKQRSKITEKLEASFNTQFHVLAFISKTNCRMPPLESHRLNKNL